MGILEVVVLVYNFWYVILEVNVLVVVFVFVIGISGKLDWEIVRVSVKYFVVLLGNVDVVI